MARSCNNTRSPRQWHPLLRTTTTILPTRVTKAHTYKYIKGPIVTHILIDYINTIYYVIYLFIHYHLILYSLCMAISNWLCFKLLSRRIHSELLIIFFQKAQGCAHRIFKVKNQQFLVYSTIYLIVAFLYYYSKHLGTCNRIVTISPPGTYLYILHTNEHC